MTRAYVDFSHVSEKHREIDKRLYNWAAWCVVHGGRFVQPMFRNYRSDESFDDVHAQQKPLPIDPSDALKIERAVVMLPESHKLATVWFYRIKTQPMRACKALGVSRAGLAELIGDARQILLNRNV